jgi:hypothetical protein
MHIQRITRLLILALICSLPVWLDSCKKSEDEPTSSSIQGNWKITAVQVNPAVQGITDLASFLKGTGESCLTDVTLSFKSDSNISYDNPASCATATTSKSILQSLFANTKYTETASEVTLTDTSGASLVATKTVSGNTISLKWTENTDLTGAAVKTTYTVQMMRI